MPDMINPATAETYEEYVGRAKFLLTCHHRNEQERIAHAGEAQAWATLALAAATLRTACQHEASDHPF